MKIVTAMNKKLWSGEQHFTISYQLDPKSVDFKPWKLREEQFSWPMQMLHKIELIEYFF